MRRDQVGGLRDGSLAGSAASAAVVLGFAVCVGAIAAAVNGVGDDPNLLWRLAAAGAATALAAGVGGWARRRPPVGPDAFERAARAALTSTPAPEPGARTRVRRLVASAQHTQGTAHARLRPLLVQIATTRLRADAGIGLENPRAPDLLGPDVWDWVRPDRQRPADHRAPGPTLPEIAALAAVLADPIHHRQEPT